MRLFDKWFKAKEIVAPEPKIKPHYEEVNRNGYLYSTKTSLLIYAQHTTSQNKALYITPGKRFFYLYEYNGIPYKPSKLSAILLKYFNIQTEYA